MRDPEDIKEQIELLANVARADSPVPDAVRIMAQNICHTLSWVMDPGVLIRPYNVIAGCCCIAPDFTQEPLGWGCALGPNRCLAPSQQKETTAV